MNIYEMILEEDLNPFVLFNSNGKVINFNKEAEFLFNFVSPKELFNLSLTYASPSFGFKKKFISLRYQKQSFYAVLVGYINDDEIILRLYKEVQPIVPINIDATFKLVNLYELIDLSKNTNLIDSSVQLEEVYDTSLPDLKLNINSVLLTLNSIFIQIKNQDNVKIRVHIKIGEYEIINTKKCNIVSIDFICKTNIEFIEEMRKQNKNSKISLFHKNNIISMEIPLIL
jgi:hypothetical protein